MSSSSCVPRTLDIGQVCTYLVPFRHCLLLFGIFKVGSGVHLGHLGAAQARKWGLKKATGSGPVLQAKIIFCDGLQKLHHRRRRPWSRRLPPSTKITSNSMSESIAPPGAFGSPSGCPLPPASGRCPEWTHHHLAGASSWGTQAKWQVQAAGVPRRTKAHMRKMVAHKCSHSTQYTLTQIMQQNADEAMGREPQNCSPKSTQKLAEAATTR
jgi:hypothetical protein